MKRITLTLAALLALSPVVPQSAHAAEATLVAADKLFQENNYAEAYVAYTNLIFNTEEIEPQRIGGVFQNVWLSLNYLDRVNEMDALIESVWVARTNFSFRLACVDVHRVLPRIGSMQKGAFVRGQGWGTNSSDRDRVRELQLLQELMPQAGGQPEAVRKNYWGTLGHVLLSEGRDGAQSELLLNLTDIGQLPDYEEAQANLWYRRARNDAGAPVDDQGQPIYHAKPTSWAAAKNDGERWRYAIEQLDEEEASEARANFAARQFCTRLLASEANHEALIAELKTLGDNETLTKLQGGVRRLTLPADYDFLTIWRKRGDWHRLGSEYRRRYQFEKAMAAYSNDLTQCQARIDEMLAPRLEIDLSGELPIAGRRGRFDLTHRNATAATFTICRVDREKMLARVKKNVLDKAKHEDWRDYAWELDHLVDGNTRKFPEEFLVGPTNTWSMALTCGPQFEETRENVAIPFDLAAGDYLLTATTEKGGEALAFLHVSGLVVVQTNPPQGNNAPREFVYRVVDARTGKPLEGVAAELFAWRSEWKARTNIVHEVKATSDAEGILRLARAKDRVQYYRGFVKLTAPDGTVSVVSAPSYYWRTEDSSGWTATKSLFVTDRPVYRPGDTVRFKVWMQRRRYVEATILRDRNLTVNLYAPQGNGKSFATKSLQLDAFGGADGEFTIPSDAALGVYTLCPANGYGAGTFRVEEYRKPEFEVAVDVPTNATMLGELVRVPVRAKYYFGEPVRKGAAKVTVRRRSTKNDWVRPSPWCWLYNQNWRRSNFERVSEQTMPLDETGTAWVTIDTTLARRLDDADDYEYEIAAEVTDESRRMIAGAGRVRVRAEPFRVHVWTECARYYVGDSVRAQVEVEGLADTQIAAKTWRLISLSTGATNEVASTFAASRAGQYRLVCEVASRDGVVRTGESILTVFGTDDDGRNYRFNPLELATDKEFYAPGETATIQISTDTPDSTVFVSVRDGEERIVPMRGKTASLQVFVTEKDYPNFGVSAWTVADGRFHQVDLSVKVPPVKKVGRAEVEIAGGAAKVFKPGEQVTATVRIFDSEGKPCDAAGVMSVYDKAVDAVAGGFNVPDMRQYFWGWTHSYGDFALLRKPDVDAICCFRWSGQRLGLWGGDLWLDFPDYDRGLSTVSCRAPVRMSSLRGTLSSNIVPVFKGRIGDVSQEDAAEMSSAKNDVPVEGIRKDFADTAYWNAALERTGTQGVYRVQFTMPEDITGWNVKVWTMGAGGRVAEVSAEIVTRKDLMVRLQTPRFLTARDATTLSANVHNYGDTARTVKVSFRTEGVRVKGDCAAQTVELAPGEELRVDWRVSVPEPGELTVTAAATDGTASDGVVRKLAVVPHRVEKTESFSRIIEPTERGGFAAPGEYTGEKGLELFRKLGFALPADVKESELQAVVEVSDTLADAIVKSLPYLRYYEYECTEQTMNRFVPAVVTRKALAGRDIGMAAEKIDDLVRKGLEKLRKMQLSEGGWGWFYGNYESPSVHLTATVLRGLLIARQNGVAVPREMLAKGLQWLGERQAKRLEAMKNATPTPAPAADDVFAAYVLQLAGTDAKKFAAETEKMLTLAYGARGFLPFYSLAQLGLAFDLHGDTARRDMVVRNLKQFLRSDDENQTCYFELRNRLYWWCWFGSDVEAQATALRLLVAAEPQSTVTRGLARYLHNNRPNRRYWTSTRDTGLAVEALAAYCAAVENLADAKGPLYVSAYLTYPSEAEPITRSGLEIRIDRVVTRNGKPLADGDAVKSGDIIDVRLDIDSKNDYEYILVEDPKGAGFEPLGTQSGYQWFRGFGAAYVEYRKRKVALFLTNLPRGTHSLSYRVRAEVPGVYHVLPAKAEAMYAPRLKGNSDELRLSVGE